MATFSPKGSPVLPEPYYRDSDGRPRKDTVTPSNAGGSPPDLSPRGPAYDGKLWATANAANVGPLCALHGRRQVLPVVIPSTFTPLGIANAPVMLIRNDETLPKFVRVRLQPAASIEGRIALGIARESPITLTEWVDLWTQSDHKIEFILENGKQLWALGAWPGVVPINIVVTVSEWTPA